VPLVQALQAQALQKQVLVEQVAQALQQAQQQRLELVLEQLQLVSE
jgi:hypothetical protein